MPNVSSTLVFSNTTLSVVPVLVGPLQILITLLPAILLAVATTIFAMLKPSAIKTFIKLMWRQKLVVAVTAVTITGSLYGIGRLRAYLAPPPADAVQGDDWPTARGTLLRTGFVPGFRDPVRQGIVWSHQDGTEGFYASPAVVGNRVYISSARLGLREYGRIYCFDADSGAIVWKYEGGGYRPTFSSPVVSGNYLVCGEGLHTTRDARIICLDARTGEELWTHRTNSHVECTPVIADGKVYVGAGDDGYYCLALEPQEPGKAKVLWHLPGEKYPDAETSLAAHNGKVYAGLGFGGKALCVLDAETGEEEARVELTFPAFSPPAISNGKLYLGTGDGDYVKVGTRGEVRCIDLKTLKTDWTFEPGNAVLGSIAVAGDRLFFGCQDMHLYALDLGGKLIGKWNAHAAINGAPAVGEKHVYVITRNGTLAAVNRQSMNFIWGVKLKAEDDSLFIGSPVVARGHVYLGTDGAGFVCVGRPAMGGDEFAQRWSGRLGGPGAAGNADDSPIPSPVTQGWHYPATTGSTTNATTIVAPPAALTSRKAENTGGVLFVPITTGPQAGVICLPASEARQTPKPWWTFSAPLGAFDSPAAGDGGVYFVDGKPGDQGRLLRKLDAESGVMIWQHTIEPGASGALLLTPAGLLVQDRVDALSLIAADGKPRWTSTVGVMRHAPTSLGPFVVVASQTPGALTALDLPTGQEIWRVTLPSPATTSPLFDGKTIFVGTGLGVVARSILDGSVYADAISDGGGVSAEMYLDTNHLIYINTTGELVFVDRVTGRTQSRHGGAAPGSVPLVSRGLVVFVGDKALMQLNLEAANPSPQPWLDFAKLGGKPSTPLILYDGSAYLGVQRAGGTAMQRLEKPQ